jgi:hypothetical protein
MPDKTTINLPHGSLEMLLSVLTAAGWTSKRREITAAGHLAETIEGFVLNRPVYKGDVVNNTPVDQSQFVAFRLEIRSWERATEPLTLTDAEFQACVACLRHFSDEKKIPANIFGATLLEQFKLSE